VSQKVQTVGQTIYFAGKAIGCALHFIFKVEAVNPERHQLGLHAFFLLDLQMKPHISCTSIDAIPVASTMAEISSSSLVGLVSRNIWRENNRCQHRRFLAAPQVCR
jgi:hypothetical protein